MKLEAIVDLIETAGEGTRGQNLFINFIPDDRAGVLLRDYFGGTPLDHEIPGRVNASFMLIVRDKNYAAGKTKIEAIVKKLQDMAKYGVEVAGVTFTFIRPRTLPFSYAPSPGENTEFAVTMDCRYLDPSLS